MNIRIYYSEIYKIENYICSKCIAKTWRNDAFESRYIPV